MSVIDIGCCGAHCKTCTARKKQTCIGCKQGVAIDDRDSSPQCEIYLCCVDHGCNTCADCDRFDDCTTLNSFFAHDGVKYRKLKQSLEFIREFGYDAFMKKANLWDGSYDKG